MGLYNFKLRFVKPIQDGTKTHTIRAKRKHPQKVGELMYLYCGLRQKGAFRIIPPPPCTKVEDILLQRDGSIYVAEVKLSLDEMEQLARRDGFSDLPEMMQFWDGKFPFSGDINYWRPPVV